MKSLLKKFIISFTVIVLSTPIIYVIVLSLSQKWVYPLLWPDILNLNNWKSLFSSQSGLLNSFMLSAVLSVSVAIISTVLGFIFSRAVKKSSKPSFYLLFAYFPFVISPIVYAICLHYYFIYFGLSGTVVGVALAQLIVLIPYNVILFFGYWTKKIFSLEQLLATLGANSSYRFAHVYWPTAKGSLVLAFLQSFLISWFDFGFSQYIGVGKIKTLTLQVFSLISEANPYLAAVASCLLILPLLVLLLINKNILIRKFV